MKDWSYDGCNFREIFLIPFGMLKALEQLYSNKKNISFMVSITRKCQTRVRFVRGEYKKEKIKSTVSHKGNKGLKTFEYICCSICQKDNHP